MSENSELNPPVGGSGLSEDLSAKMTETHRPGSGRQMEPKETPGSMNMLWGVHLTLTVELGRTNLTVRQVIDLQKGSVVELDRIAGEAVDVYVNDRLIAKGDVVVVDDKFGVRITELISPIQEG